MSKEAGLFTWDKPAYACLATRMPTGHRPSPAETAGSQVERARKLRCSRWALPISGCGLLGRRRRIADAAETRWYGSWPHRMMQILAAP